MLLALVVLPDLSLLPARLAELALPCFKRPLGARPSRVPPARFTSSPGSSARFTKIGERKLSSASRILTNFQSPSRTAPATKRRH